MKIPTTPHGWRRIFGKTVIQCGDRWWNKHPAMLTPKRGQWEFTEIGPGVTVSKMINIYIRKRAKP